MEQKLESLQKQEHAGEDAVAAMQEKVDQKKTELDEVNEQLRQLAVEFLAAHTISHSQ